MTDFDKEACLALVEQSPAAASVHDKAAWLKLFASANVVEDPVGSAPHVSGVGGDRLERFYETFIAPNEIRFHVDRDVVCGLHVVRDLTIEIRMSTAVTVRVPMHLLYELTEEGGELRVARLAAHWELWPMLKQQIETGWPFVKVGTASGLRMLRYLGVGGMLGFARALSSVGEPGKAQLDLFARYFNAGQVEGLKALFSDSSVRIAFPQAGRALSIGECADAGGALAFTKVLAAGNVVSATVTYQSPESHYQGVVFMALARENLAIDALSFYWEDNPGGQARRGDQYPADRL